MSSTLSPPTLPRSANLVHVRLAEPARGDPALRGLTARLHELNTPPAWRAVVLALMVTPGSGLEREAWQAATQPLRHAARLFDDLLGLPPPRRLPWFEHFARALAPGSATQRHDLIDAARRLLTADGLVSPMDQLRWVTLRHLLAGSAVSAPAAAHAELETLDDVQVNAICVFSSFLSKLVPTPEIMVDLTGYGSVSQAWYDSVTAPWQDRADIPPREGHDIDAALRALRRLQSLPWLLRPVLARSWFDAARALTEGPALHDQAADALRLSCVLLDSPLPPELGQQYIEVEPVRH